MGRTITSSTYSHNISDLQGWPGLGGDVPCSAWRRTEGGYAPALFLFHLRGFLILLSQSWVSRVHPVLLFLPPSSCICCITLNCTNHSCLYDQALILDFFDNTQVQFEQLTQERSAWLLGDRDMVGEGWETQNCIPRLAVPGCVWGDGPSCFGYHDIKPHWKRQFHRGSVPPVAIWCLSVSRERSQACGKVPHASSPVNSNKGALIRSVVLAGGSMCQEKKARCSAEIRPSLQCIHQYV